MNYEILKAALVGLEAQSDAEAAATLNAPDAALFSERLVTYRSILNECDGAGTILDKLETASAGIPDLKWAMVGIASDGIDIGNAKVRVMVDQLVAGAVLTSDEGDALKAMAYTQSKAASLGLGSIKEGQVADARAL